MSSSNSVGDFNLDNVNLRKNPKFPDGTVQTSSANGLLYYTGLPQYGFGNLGNVTPGSDFTIYTFTGLVPNKRYLVNGYCVIQSTGTLSNLQVSSRLFGSAGVGTGYTYGKLYTSTFNSGDNWYVSFNDYIDSGNDGIIGIALRTNAFTGGTLAVTSGQIRAMRIQL